MRLPSCYKHCHWCQHKGPFTTGLFINGFQFMFLVRKYDIVWLWLAQIPLKIIGSYSVIVGGHVCCSVLIQNEQSYGPGRPNKNSRPIQKLKIWCQLTSNSLIILSIKIDHWCRVAWTRGGGGLPHSVDWAMFLKMMKIIRKCTNFHGRTPRPSAGYRFTPLALDYPPFNFCRKPVGLPNDQVNILILLAQYSCWTLW
jgi:hypothetical protein